jgi:TnpA family transposase
MSSAWSLSLEELELANTKPAAQRLGFAIQLKVYGLHRRFFETVREIPVETIEVIAAVLGRPITDALGYEWEGRTGRRHREEILKLSNTQPMSLGDRDMLRQQLLGPVGVQSTSAVMEHAETWCREHGFRPPAKRDLDRLVRSLRRDFEAGLLDKMTEALSPEAVEKLEASLLNTDGVCGFDDLKADPGRAGLENLVRMAGRLTFIRSLGLSVASLSGVDSAYLETLRRRVSQESAWDMRRRPRSRRLGLYALFLADREKGITDALVDLLIETVHKMHKKAQRKVMGRMTRDLTRVHHKDRMLFKIAKAALANPDGKVRDVVFAVASQERLEAVVAEYEEGGTYHEQVQKALRASYGGHYRRLLPHMLDALEFRCNNVQAHPVLTALNWLKGALNEEPMRRVIRSGDGLPIDGIVPAKWRDLIVETTATGWRVDRIDYEVCVLLALRDRLRCKEIWVVGADRYRNPDDDVPKDFETRRSQYYQELAQPANASDFVDKIKADLAAALGRLNIALPRQSLVRLRTTGEKRISLTPLEPLSEPTNLVALKAEIDKRWTGTGLLDVLKETALRTGMLRSFTTSGDRVILSEEDLHKRLLLSLYALGTNAGLRRVCSGHDGVSYSELLHVERRFLSREGLRDANALVTNAILAQRLPSIWGESTASCASDSKKFGAWDQNLMTEWHMRYGGRGVMIYWHVERKSTCIHSQLKRCSSSEVAAMIEGVLRHCTDAEVKSQFVDSHGQSEVAFAFCHMLGFELAPRLKGISRQRLYLPDLAYKDTLGSLSPILTRAIDWDLISQQYDEIVKYTAALRHRTAEPEALLRRFTRANVQHPTYRALAELGKAVKTIFLCRYLAEEPYRREINAGLNVVENWNSANGFIYFGKGGEISSNRMEDQELSVLALQLLQNSLVYVNTLMLQKVLQDPAWSRRMTEADWRGLSPLIYQHVNPYGQFELDLEQRIDFDRRLAA